MIFISDPEKHREKEELYIAVRQAEGRIVDEEMLRILPYPLPGYVHAAEWAIRAANFERFCRKLSNRYPYKRLNILDVGCGNGWMAHRLCRAGHTVTGVDLNIDELHQAEKVFGQNEHLQWLYADVMNDTVPGAPFDVVVFGASGQYFSDIAETTKKLKPLLANGGSIHLLDSFFYKERDLPAARARTADYYKSVGYPTMSKYYFHHSVQDLRKAGYKKLYPGLLHPSGRPQWWVCYV